VISGTTIERTTFEVHMLWLSRMPRWVGSLAAAGLLGLMLAAAPAMAQKAPDELVRSVADDVLKVMRQDRELRAGSQSKMAELIEEKIAPHFDFERMTRLAVGKNWRQATPEQQKSLVQEFRNLLVRSYSAAYSAYKELTVEVKPLKLQPNDEDVQVRTLIKLPGDAPPVSVDYSMYKSPASWKVYDVVVDGVSLVTTYRSSFADQIRQSGIDGLVKSLQELNSRKAQPAKKPQ
jgi:phospholipid transport system substrate-binding protein